MNSSEETLEDLHAEFGRAFSGGGEALTKFGNKLRKRYFKQIERIEHEFQNVLSSNSQGALRAFLLENNFLFRALSANVLIYNNCSIANDLKVDCILVGFKSFDSLNIWITFIKLEPASSHIWDKEEDLDNYLSPSIAQVKRWLNWQKVNTSFFENQIRERMRKDLSDPKFLSLLDSMDIQTDSFIIAGYEGKYDPKQPYVSNLLGDESGTIKTVPYDSLFKTIYEENNRTIMSSGWWTEDICKTENAMVINDVSFAG